jgi:hypothetical protein
MIAALIGGCGDLPTTSEGVAFLEVVPPLNRTIGIGDTVRFRARALDALGEPKPEVVITWQTPDPDIISIDEFGLVTGLAAGAGRVQAVIGTVDEKQKTEYFASDLVSLTVTSPLILELALDTLVIQQGLELSNVLTLTRTNFTAEVTLALEGAPTGVTSAFAPNPATAATSTLTVTVAGTVAPGDYSLTVRGTATGIADRTVPLTLRVTPALGGSTTSVTSRDHDGPAARW